MQQEVVLVGGDRGRVSTEFQEALPETLACAT